MGLFDALEIGSLVIVAFLLFFGCWAATNLLESIQRFSYAAERRARAYERYVNYKIECFSYEGSECHGTERDYDRD